MVILKSLFFGGSYMERKERIEYLISTLCVAVTGFIIYGFLGSTLPIRDWTKLQKFVYWGLLGGVGFSMMLSSILLAVRFFKKKSTVFKTVAALLWPITFFCVVYVGVFSYIPYQIYNIVKIVQCKKQS